MAAASSSAAAHRALTPAPAALASFMRDFIETTLHLILHDRRAYPSSLFEDRRAYGVAVRACRHPLLNAYIAQLADSIQSWLVLGEMQRIVLVLLDPARSESNTTAAPVCVERFVIELCFIPPTSSAAAATSSDSSTLSTSDRALLTEQFGAILTRMIASKGHFKQRCKEPSWTILLYTNQDTPTIDTTKAATAGGVASRVKVFDPAPHRWSVVPLCAHDAVAAANASKSSSTGMPPHHYLDFHPDNSRIMPIKTVRTELVHMEVYCEASGESEPEERDQPAGAIASDARAMAS